MAEPWTDDRLDAALLALADQLDVPGDGGLADRPAPRRPARPSWLAAATVVPSSPAWSPSHRRARRWPAGSVSASSATTARRRRARSPTASRSSTSTRRSALAGLDRATFEAAPLGLPDAAGTPPEGGRRAVVERRRHDVVGAPGDDDVVVVKRLIGSRQAELVSDLGDYAVLIDGDHVLDTPSRASPPARCCGGWPTDRQWRLESQLDPATMLTMARALTP